MAYIKTKYEIGQYVHFMRNNVPTVAMVDGIKIECVKRVVGYRTQIYYSLRGELLQSYGEYEECDLFASKEDLKQALFK